MKRVLTAIFCAFTFSNLNAQVSTPISFQHDGLTVNGVFTKPNNSGKFPVIIINAGTGANDKDGTLQMAGGNIPCLYPNLLNTTLRPYKELGDALVDSGFAVLRYDKLEYTYQSQPNVLSPISFYRLWLPVMSAIDYVKTRADVDTHQIILLGHSEGSTLIPHIAKNRTDVKALISVGGPRQPLDSLLAYQLVYFAQTCGGDVTMAQAQAGQVLSYFQDVRTGNFNSNTPPLFGVQAAVWQDYMNMADSVSIHYNIAALPTLFIGLGKDINVPPTELIRLQNEVTITNDFWSIPDLIHYMTPDNDPHVSEALTDTLVYWLRQQNTTDVKTINQLEKNITVSPNPFKDNINIRLRDLKGENIQIRLVDHQGKEYYKDTVLPKQNAVQYPISTENLQTGLYFLQVEMKGDTITHKLMKE